MSETPSNMLPLGTPAPKFTLLDTVTNQLMSLDELRSKTATVIMFICNHCPYVIHLREKIISVAREYSAKGVSFIAISSNDASKYPADGPTAMHDEAIKYHYSFPYLYDASQDVAKQYQAACTPDFYLFDGNLLCVYRGRFDDATPGNNKPITGYDLVNALECLLTNKPISQQQFPSVGCNIKWIK